MGKTKDLRNPRRLYLKTRSNLRVLFIPWSGPIGHVHLLCDRTSGESASPRWVKRTRRILAASQLEILSTKCSMVGDIDNVMSANEDSDQEGRKRVAMKLKRAVLRSSIETLEFGWP